MRVTDWGQTSKLSRTLLISSEFPERNFKASADCSEEMIATIGPITPAVSQVGVVPGAGADSIRQRRQAVSPGMIFMTTP